MSEGGWMGFSRIKIIVSEIDGVITDGCVPIDYMNNTLFKTYCVHDFEAINELKSYFTFVFLSSDTAVSYNIMRSRNIPAYFITQRDDKLRLLTKRILPHYNAQPDNLLYIGSMYSDLPCMKLAGISMSSESATGVSTDVTCRIPVAPGKGIISYVANILRTEMAVRKRKE